MCHTLEADGEVFTHLGALHGPTERIFATILSTKEDIALYRGAHFKGQRGFSGKLDIVRGILEEILRPPLLPSISAHVCTASPPPRQNHRVKEYRLPNIFLK